MYMYVSSNIEVKMECYCEDNYIVMVSQETENDGIDIIAMTPDPNKTNQEHIYIYKK